MHERVHEGYIAELGRKVNESEGVHINHWILWNVHVLVFFFDECSCISYELLKLPYNEWGLMNVFMKCSLIHSLCLIMYYRRRVRYGRSQGTMES